MINFANNRIYQMLEEKAEKGPEYVPAFYSLSLSDSSKSFVAQIDGKYRVTATGLGGGGGDGVFANKGSIYSGSGGGGAGSCVFDLKLKANNQINFSINNDYLRIVCNSIIIIELNNGINGREGGNQANSISSGGSAIFKNTSNLISYNSFKGNDSLKQTNSYELYETNSVLSPTKGGSIGLLSPWTIMYNGKLGLYGPISADGSIMNFYNNNFSVKQGSALGSPCGAGGDGGMSCVNNDISNMQSTGGQGGLAAVIIEYLGPST